jgi:hypothetical protein
MKVDSKDGQDSQDIPSRGELVSSLIQAELKLYRFTKSLATAGIDPSVCTPDFSSIILALAGFRKRPDDVFEMYQAMLDEFSDRLTSCDDPKVTDVANDFYQKLIAAGNRQG